MRSSVSFACRQCRRPLERAFPSDESAKPCEKCGAAVDLDPSSIVDGAVTRCPVCRGEMLFHQKDFRQAIGCIVVLIAAVLAPFTYYVSLGVAALIDAILYWLAGEVVVCYRVTCRAHVRGVPYGPKVGAFDLSIHDYHRMLARREAQGLPGPDDSTGPPLDSMSHH